MRACWHRAGKAAIVAREFRRTDRRKTDDGAVIAAVIFYLLEWHRLPCVSMSEPRPWHGVQCAASESTISGMVLQRARHCRPGSSLGLQAGTVRHTLRAELR